MTRYTDLALDWIKHPSTAYMQKANPWKKQDESQPQIAADFARIEKETVPQFTLSDIERADTQTNDQKRLHSTSDRYG